MGLYKIERMKIRLSTYRWAISGIFVTLLALGIMYLFLGVSGPEISLSVNGEKEDMLFTSWDGLFALSTGMTVGFFGVFSAILAAKIIVEEYCGRKAVLLFTYPVSRQKLLAVKCAIVQCISTVAALASNVLVTGGMCIVARIFGITPEAAEGLFAIKVLLCSLFSGILSSEIGMIAAVIGWKKRSVMTTVISALVIVCFVPNLIANSLAAIMWVMLFLSVILGLAVMAMYRILANGIEKMEV